MKKVTSVVLLVVLILNTVEIWAAGEVQILVVIPAAGKLKGHAEITKAAILQACPYIKEEQILLIDSDDLEYIEGHSVKYNIPFIVFNILRWTSTYNLRIIDSSPHYWFVPMMQYPEDDMDTESDGTIVEMKENLIACGSIDDLWNRTSGSGTILEFVEPLYIFGRNECKPSYAAGVIFAKFITYYVEMGYDLDDIYNIFSMPEIFRVVRQALRESAIENSKTHKIEDWNRFYGFGRPATHYDEKFNANTPIELVNFRATHVVVGGSVLVGLFWESLSETNNLSIGVEVSTDSLSRFQRIGEVSGQGTTASTTYYHFLDDKPVDPNETYYFRLKQTDTDGSFAYSKIICLGPYVSTEIKDGAKRIKHHLPMVFQLKQNYPNPFNGSTTIEFHLFGSDHVTLEVFSSLGQWVKTLADGDFESGTHGVAWNATDEFGDRVASGVYFYKIVAGDRVATKKMLLAK